MRLFINRTEELEPTIYQRKDENDLLCVLATLRLCAADVFSKASHII